MTVTRSFCPLCDWHHDDDHTLTEPPQVTVEADVLASGDLAAISSAVTSATMTAMLAETESVIRAHLETHTLLEWVAALTAAQHRITTMQAEQERYEETVVGALNETITRLSRRVARAEVEPACPYDYHEMAGEGITCVCQPHSAGAAYGCPEGCPTHNPGGEDVPEGAIGGRATDDELVEAGRYADMVNAPLRPETIAAIARRIKASDYPVRKVRARIHDVGREPAVMAIPDDELSALLALADEEPVRELTLPQVMAFHRLTGQIIDQAQRERWKAAGRCGVCGFDGDRTGCQDCDGGQA